ncbi:PIN domain-like protein [Scleroderma citrinum]
MRINGLWTAVAPTASQCVLDKFVISEGFHPCNTNGTPQLMHIGFDASLWMHAICNVFIYNHTSASESPKICTIFYQLVTILQMLLHAHFVFNGPQRSKLKHEKQVKNAPHFLMQCFQELLSAFGFTWHEAPGEAEAKLTKLNAVGIIDAIFSDDSDILLFGAPCIIGSSLQHEHYDVIEVFMEDTLEHGAHLTQGGLLLIVLMSGGDYDDSI